MEDETDKPKLEDITIIDLSGHDADFQVPDLSVTGTYAADTITISPSDWTSHLTSIDMSSGGGNITAAATTYGNSGSVYTIGNTGSYGGNITFNDTFTSNANIHIGGEDPKLKTDKTEIDINELAGVVEAIKQIIDTNELPIFDRAFRDKHEILQKSWEDIKQAYENYRLTEALLKSTGPGENNDNDD